MIQPVETSQGNVADSPCDGRQWRGDTEPLALRSVHCGGGFAHLWANASVRQVSGRRLQALTFPSLGLLNVLSTYNTFGPRWVSEVTPS